MPDYVDDVAADAEAVWRAEVVDRGFAPPPSDDGAGVRRGGDGRYDIYLIDFDAHGQAGLLGLTVADPVRSRRSYLLLDDDYADVESPGSTTAPADRRRVTLAHEFFHAIQDGYGPGFASLPEWLAEGTATWMESDVYPQIADNRWYLDSLVGSGTEAPLWSSKGVHVYGTWWFVRAATARRAEGAAWLRRLLRRSVATHRTHRRAELDGGIDLLAAVSGGRASFARLLRRYAVDNLTRWFGPRLDVHHATLRPGVWWTSRAKKLTALQATYWRLRLPGRRVVVRVRGDAGLVSGNGVALVLGGRRVRTAVRHLDGDTLELRGTVPADLPERVDLVLTQARALEGSYEITALAPAA